MSLALFNRGETLETIGYHDRAIMDLDQVIKLNPDNAPAFNSRGLAWNNKRDFDRAINDFSQALRLDGKLAAAYNNRGIAYRAKGDNDRAIADFSTAAKIDPNYAMAFSNRGNAYFDKRDYDRAIADLNQAIKLNPNYVRAYYDRGIAYGAKGDADRAIADFDHALKLDPQERHRAQQSRPRLPQQGRQPTAPSPISARRSSSMRTMPSPTTTAATPISTSATTTAPSPTSARRSSSTPKTPFALHDRGVAYYQKHDFERAIADFEAAIKIVPNYTVAAQPARRAMRAPSAATTATPAKARSRSGSARSSRSPIMTRGIDFASKNDIDHAIADFDRAIKINPNCRPPTTIAATPISRSATMPSAVANYDAAIRLNPKDAMAYYDRGVARYEREDYDRAVADFDQATKLDRRMPPPSTTAASPITRSATTTAPSRISTRRSSSIPSSRWPIGARGYALAGHGDYDKAIADLTQAIKLDGDQAMRL